MSYFRAGLVRNVYKRRGASLKGKVENTEGLQEQDTGEYVRSIRQSPHYLNSPAIRLLMARRHQQQQQQQQWSGEPQTDSSETVIVKSLPLPPSHFYSGGREALVRAARDPQIHNFLLEEHEDTEIQRGTFLETPRSAALIAPVQNILPDPVPAVPSLPVGRVVGPGRHPLAGPLLRAVPAVPDLPTISSFTTALPRTASSSTTRPTTRRGSHSVSTSARSLSRGSFSRPPFRNPSPTARARQKLVTTPSTETHSISVTTARARKPLQTQTETSVRLASRGVGRETQLPETTRSRTSPFPSTHSPRTTVGVTTRRPVKTVKHILDTQTPSTTSEHLHHPELG